MSIANPSLPVSDAADNGGISSSLPRLLAFEMEVGGHHPGYVRNFSQSWVQHDIRACIDFVVTPRFFEKHPDVVEFVTNLRPDRVRIHRLTDEESTAMERFSYLRYFKAWKYFCEYAQRLKADRGLLMYYDFFQLPSLLGKRCPIPYSAMYFRPTFHYGLFEGFQPGIKEWLRAERKRWLLARVLQDPMMHGLYCLDEVAVEYIPQHFKTNVAVRRVADSFSQYPSSIERQTEFLSDLSVEDGRTIFCLLGGLDRRKGVKELLECLELIPEDQAQKICVLLLGVISADQQEEVDALIQRVRRQTPVQLVVRNRYILDHEVQHYYDLSDVILATYQGHMGSSSALIRAALSGKPVLSADYGLMGEIVKRRRLGLTVDTTNPSAMANGLVKFVDGSGVVEFDNEKATSFAQDNSPQQLASDLASMIF